MLRVTAEPMMLPEDARLLVELAEHRNVVEVGSFVGGSTVLMARVAAHVVSVDHHRGDPWTGPAPTLAAFLEVLAGSGVRERVTAVLDDWRAFLPVVDREWAQLVFLDAEHDGPSVAEQLGVVLRWRRAIVAVHDADLGEVREAVDYQAHHHCRRVRGTATMAVIV